MSPLEAVMPTFCPTCGSMRIGEPDCECVLAAPVGGIVSRLMELALPADVVVPNLRNLIRGAEDLSALMAELKEMENALVLDFTARFAKEPLLRHMGEAEVRPEVRAHLVVLARASGAAS